jgi:uncharacterized protein (DUF2141 family)
MKNISYTIVIIGFLILIRNISLAQSLGTLTIKAANLENEKGKAVVHLFRKEDDIPSKPFLKSSTNISKGKAEIVFQNLPYGQYAAILFHDENGNEILDHKWGFPNEPMGFSNEWKLTLFSGMPSFEKLKFDFTERSTVWDIKIK